MDTLLSNQIQKSQYYQTDQQMKYLHLEAEINLLLQKLTTLKQQKQLLEKLSAKSPEFVELNVG